MKFKPKFVSRVRKEFPRVSRDPAGRKRIFLDNGAGTLVTRRSAEREQEARMDWSANVGNVFPESRGAELTILEGREAVADFLNAEGPMNIVSGESATSLMFNLSYALGREFEGTENVVTTGYEHYTNVNPWVELGANGMIDELRFADFDRETGRIDTDAFSELVDDDTAVVTVTAASNVLGTVSDLRRIGKIAKEVGAYFIVDAVHHVAHGPMNVKTIGCDFLVFSGYKLFSRHGSFMYMKSEPMEQLMPYKVLPAPQHGPEKWEWGTRDQAMFAAINGAIDYIAWLGNPSTVRPPKAGKQRRTYLEKAFEDIEEYEEGLSELMLNGEGRTPGLLGIEGLTLYGPKDLEHPNGRDPTFSFKLAGYEDRNLSELLWKKFGIAVGAEDYFSRVPALYDAKTMTRATLVHYNTEEEALALLRALSAVAGKSR